MAERYFTKFPIVTYGNTITRDITRRVTISDTLLNSPFLFEDFVLPSALRPDAVASDYYDDPHYEWLLMLSNGVVDPYHGWYLSSADFDEFIIKKYGSIELAQSKIYYYQINWPSDESEISVEFYENNLDYNFRKYYTPVYNSFDKILNYRRKDDDFTTSTNKLINFDVTITSGNSFTVGELLNIKNSALSQIVGGAEVVFANSSVVKVKNISGNTSATNKIVGTISNTVATIANTIVVATSISDEEASYWSPVYYYEYEYEKNEKNRNIRLYSNEYALEAAESLRIGLKANVV